MNTKKMIKWLEDTCALVLYDCMDDAVVFWDTAESNAKHYKALRAFPDWDSVENYARWLGYVD